MVSGAVLEILEFHLAEQVRNFALQLYLVEFFICIFAILLLLIIIFRLPRCLWKC